MAVKRSLGVTWRDPTGPAWRAQRAGIDERAPLPGPARRVSRVSRRTTASGPRSAGPTRSPGAAGRCTGTSVRNGMSALLSTPSPTRLFGVRFGSAEGAVEERAVALGDRAELDVGDVVGEATAVREAAQVAVEDGQAVGLAGVRGAAEAGPVGAGLDGRVDPEHVGEGRLGADRVHAGDALQQDERQVRPVRSCSRHRARGTGSSRDRRAPAPRSTSRTACRCTAAGCSSSPSWWRGMMTSLMSGLPRRETCCHGPDHLTCAVAVDRLVLAPAGARPDADDRLSRRSVARSSVRSAGPGWRSRRCCSRRRRRHRGRRRAGSRAGC